MHTIPNTYHHKIKKMDSKMPPLTPVLLFLFFLISHTLGDTEDLINKICGETESFKICEDVFVRNLYTPDTDIKGLTQIALTQALAYGSDTLVFIDRARDNNQNPNIKNSYLTCDSGYRLLVDQLEVATLAFAQGDYRTVVNSAMNPKVERVPSDCQYVLGRYLPNLGGRTIKNRVLNTMVVVSGRILTGQRVKAAAGGGN